MKSSVSAAKKRRKNASRKHSSLIKTIFTLIAKGTLVLGIICFLAVFNMVLLRTFPVAKPVIQQTAAAQRTPAEIIIRDAHIDLPIVTATLNKGIFETTDKGASYLTSSPLPGAKGNSIIYAHNWWNLFGNLPKLQKGENISVLYTDKSQQTFTIAETKTVTAHDISILNPTTNNQLTLFTCANFLDADRFVVIAIADK